MPNNVVFIRHGQSMGNVDWTMYQRPDSAVCLTSKGVMQALHAADELSAYMDEGKLKWRWHGLHAFSSEYSRAKQTARICLDAMGMLHVKPWVIPALNERRWGNYDSEDRSVNKKNPEWRPGEDGETLLETADRFAQWFGTVENLLSDKDIVMFCHGELMMAAQWYLLTDHTSMPDITTLYRMPSSNAVPVILLKDRESGQYIRSPMTFTKYDPETEDVVR